MNPRDSKWHRWLVMPRRPFEGKNWIIKHGYECVPQINKFTGDYNTSGIPQQWDGIRAYAMDKDLRLIRNAAKEPMVVAIVKVRDIVFPAYSDEIMYLHITNNDPKLNNDELDNIFVRRWTTEPVEEPQVKRKIPPDTRDYMRFDDRYKRKKK